MGQRRPAARPGDRGARAGRAGRGADRSRSQGDRVADFPERRGVS